MSYELTQANAQKFFHVVLPFFLGGISGVISKTVTAPFERITIVLQVQDLKEKEMRYKGIIDALIQIPRREGVLAFWRGNATNCGRYFFTQAITFFFNDKISRALVKWNNLPGAEGHDRNAVVRNCFFSVLSGGLAGTLALMVMFPLEFVRTRLTADLGSNQQKNYTGVIDVIRKTTQKEGGIRSLYRGFWISAAMAFPYRGLYFGGYATLKALFMTENPSFVKRWIVSQVVTTVSQMVVFPMDTIRRRIMLLGEGGKPTTQAHSGTMTLPPGSRVNSWTVCKAIVEQEGFTGLFKGGGANVLRSMGAALCLALYDTMKESIDASKALEAKRE